MPELMKNPITAIPAKFENAELLNSTTPGGGKVNLCGTILIWKCCDAISLIGEEETVHGDSGNMGVSKRENRKNGRGYRSFMRFRKIV